MALLPTSLRASVMRSSKVFGIPAAQLAAYARGAHLWNSASECCRFGLLLSSSKSRRPLRSRRPKRLP
eukprot:735307-Hanusia_phi.AAC.1